MTFVGKILVIIILVFSLFFLALSAVVFTTQANWREKNAVQTKTISENNKKVTDLTAKVEATVKERDAAQAQSKTDLEVLNRRIADLTSNNVKVQKEITENRTLLETAQQNAKTSMDVAADRTKETDELRTIVRSTQDQANQFKEQQRDLNERIRILERELRVAVDANKSLRDRTAKLTTLLTNNHIDTDIESVEARKNPPRVEGKVTRVDARNKMIEMSIGSDDGLVVGHVLSIFRTKPNADYKGRVRIMSVDPDQAVGEVIEHDKGKKIEEGDDVATEIRPRG